MNVSLIIISIYVGVKWVNLHFLFSQIISEQFLLFLVQMKLILPVEHFFPWRYTTHSGCVFYSPLSGFSLLAYEVT